MPSLKTRTLKAGAAIAVPARPAEVAKVTFAELCAAYCAVVFDGADYVVRKWVGTLGLGPLPAWSITRDMLEAGMREMTAKDYLPSTINRDISQIGSIYKWARKKRMSPTSFRSPTADIERLDEAERVVEVSARELAKLLAGSFAARDKRFAPYVHLLHDSGARASEILLRRWKDVDLDRRTMTAGRTKNGRPRVLFYSAKTADLMRKVWPASQRAPELMLFQGRFPGVPIKYRAAWVRLVAAIGRPDLHQHDMRHVVAQRLLKNRVTIPVATQIMGHSSNILMKKYGHLETGALQDAAMAALGD